jgi:Ricin-type beta-trefoil lectin domain
MNVRKILIWSAVAGGLLLLAPPAPPALAAEQTTTSTVYGPFQFKSSNNSKCLGADPKAPIGNSGAGIQLRDCLDKTHPNQIWYFESTPVAGQYRVRNGSNNRCLDADLATIGTNGTELQLWDCLGPDRTDQYWRLRASSNYLHVFHLVNLRSGQCLDADLPSINTPDAKVQLWSCHGDANFNQDWYFG